jgi:endonuclease/exonuclease/phosphatase family metal-dependent hydrolase
LLVNTALTALSQDQGLKVMTFNIRFDNPADGANSWNNRKSLVIKTLGENAPDLIGMQEVLQQQLIFLENNLKDYNAIGVGRDDGKAGGEYSPVLYRTERFKLLNWGTFWLSNTPNDTGSVGWDAALPRICTWAKMEDIHANRQLFVLNTHFDHMGTEARKESARLIMEFIANRTFGLPVILTGDFNCTPEEDPYTLLTNPGGAMKDACLAANPDKGCDTDTFNGFGSSPEKERIDLVLVKGNFEVESYSMLEIKEGEMFISDHYPILVKLNE